MKTLKSVLIVTAATAAFTLTAGEPLQTPRGSQVGHPIISSSSVQDPNLIAGVRLGKNTAEAATLAKDSNDVNLAAQIANCPMAPKTKDTPACQKHCESMAKK